MDTYDALKTALSGWTHRADLTTYLGDFIAFAENRIFSDLKVKEMEVRADFTPTSRFLATPTGLTSIRRITTKSTPPTELLAVSADWMAKSYETSSGTPNYFTVLGDEIEFNRTPNCDVEIVYYASPTALSDANPTNSIIAIYPQVYLAAAMIEASLFMVNDAGVSKWTSVYNEALARANMKTTTFQTSGPMAARVA